MLHKRLVTRVDADQLFYYAGRKYVLANEMECRKHPGAGNPDAVLAFHVPDSKAAARQPVTFNPLTEVFVDTK